MCNIRSNCPNHHSPVVSGFQLPTFQTRFTHKFIMLLLASSDSKNSSFTWHWVRKDIGTRFRLLPCWRLQHRAGRSRKATTDRLQRVLNAARVVSETHKFDRGLTHLLHCELHWLDVPQRIKFKLGVTVRRWLRGNAPQYLVNCCKSTTDVASRQRLRSASRHQLIVPQHRRSKFGRRLFSVAGATAWNSLPDYLRDPSLSEDTFMRSLKTCHTCLRCIRARSAIDRDFA